MLKPEFTGQFKRDYRLAVKQGCNPKKLEEVITLLCNEQPLPDVYRDHALRICNAMKYEVQALNQQVKRNIGRFQEDFMFQLCFGISLLEDPGMVADLLNRLRTV